MLSVKVFKYFIHKVFQIQSTKVYFVFKYKISVLVLGIHYAHNKKLKTAAA